MEKVFGGLRGLWEKDREAELPKLAAAEGTVPGEQRMLSLSQLSEASEKYQMSFSNEHALDVKRTVMVRGLPFEVTSEQLFKMGSETVKGGIRMIRLYPKGGLKSALIEFNTADGHQKKFAQKIMAIDPSITFEPAKLCIRQALLIELENEFLRASELEKNLQEAQRQLQAAEQRTSELENQRKSFFQEKEILNERLNTEIAKKKCLEERLQDSELETMDLSADLARHKHEAHLVKKELYTTKLKLLIAQNKTPNICVSEDGDIYSSPATSTTTSTEVVTPIEDLISDKERNKVEFEITEFEREARRQALLEKGAVRIKQNEIIKAKRLELFVRSCITFWKEWARRKSEIRHEEELTRNFLEEEKRQRQREAEEKLYSCPICYCDYTIEHMYTLDGCFHRFCFECLGQYLEVKITEGQVQRLACPNPKCSESISSQEIKHCVDEELFTKYEEFSLQSALSQIPDLRWCPKAGCSNAMIGDPEHPMMVCSNTECRYTFCFKCKEEWHADINCEQYQQWKIENSESEARYSDWAKANTKKCPNCNSDIEKNGGCNHMTCTRCSHQFCWLCLATYASNHWETSSCKQFT